MFALQWHRLSCAVHDQLQFSGGVMHVFIASHSEGLQKLWWGLFDSHLVIKTWVFLNLLSRDRCLPSRLGQCVDPTSLLTDLQIRGCRSVASCCISASGCISPKRNQKRALQETFVLILNFFSLCFKKMGNDRVIFYYLFTQLLAVSHSDQVDINQA